MPITGNPSLLRINCIMLVKSPRLRKPPINPLLKNGKNRSVWHDYGGIGLLIWFCIQQPHQYSLDRGHHRPFVFWNRSDGDDDIDSRTISQLCTQVIYEERILEGHLYSHASLTQRVIICGWRTNWRLLRQSCGCIVTKREITLLETKYGANRPSVDHVISIHV